MAVISHSGRTFTAMSWNSSPASETMCLRRNMGQSGSVVRLNSHLFRYEELICFSMFLLGQEGRHTFNIMTHSMFAYTAAADKSLSFHAETLTCERWTLGMLCCFWSTLWSSLLQPAVHVCGKQHFKPYRHYTIITYEYFNIAYVLTQAALCLLQEGTMRSLHRSGQWWCSSHTVLSVSLSGKLMFAVWYHIFYSWWINTY